MNGFGFHNKLLSLLVLLSAPFIVLLISNQSVFALNSSDFSPGHIIDDDVFTYSSALSVSEIQNFLNAQVPVCDVNGSDSITYYYNSSTGKVSNAPFSGGSQVTTTRATYGQHYDSYENTTIAAAPYVCLKSYVENPQNGQNNLQNPNASIAGGESSAQIIYNAAQAYNINPEVIIVTLQKEQGLVTDDWPWVNEYDEAMGFNCPDGGGCSGYPGFYQQVNAAAQQYQNYLNNPNDFNYVVGNNTIDYNAPEDGCSASSTVDILNQATAALYDYTPYQPDSNVLNKTNPTGSANGPGGTVSGDNCAAYGNRNFWWYFNTWFGSSLSDVSVNVTQYNATTDNTGSAATLGFSLSQRPQSPVTIPLSLSANAPAAFSSPSSITIQPNNWNQPQLNEVVIYGLNNSTSGGVYYTLITGSLQTSDPQFSLLTADYTPDISLVQLNNASTDVYRLYSPTTQQHFYTTSASEEAQMVSDGWNNEGVGFSYCSGGENTVFQISEGELTLMVPVNNPELQTDLSQGWILDGPVFSSSRGADVPVYRLYDPTSGDHLFTESATEYNNAQQDGYNPEGVAFDACAPNQQPVYRLYNPTTGAHFYTTSSQERDAAGGAGYLHEGVGFYLCDTDQDVPIFRLYNPSTGKHFYTASSGEQITAELSGYSSEGVGFSMCDDDVTPIYRLFDAQSQDHLYTSSSAEVSAAEQSGYVYEGIGFYTTP